MRRRRLRASTANAMDVARSVRAAVAPIEIPTMVREGRPGCGVEEDGSGVGVIMVVDEVEGAGLMSRVLRAVADVEAVGAGSADDDDDEEVKPADAKTDKSL